MLVNIIFVIIGVVLVVYLWGKFFFVDKFKFEDKIIEKNNYHENYKYVEKVWKERNINFCKDDIDNYLKYGIVPEQN